MIHSQKDWSEFKKDEVGIHCVLPTVIPIDTDSSHRSSRRSSRSVISISRSRLAVSAVPTSTPSPVFPPSPPSIGIDSY